MKTIALFNPSYEHLQERSLWSALYERFNCCDYQVFEFQCRAVPTNPRAAQYVFPARLKDFGRKIKDGDAAVPGWFTKEELEFSVNWETKRWRLTEGDRSEVESGAIRLATTIDLFLESHSPSLVIVYNEIDHPQRLALLAAKDKCLPFRIMERSPFMGVWLENEGLFDRSRAFVTPLHPGDENLSRELVQMLCSQVEGFRSGQNRGSPKLERFKRPLVLLILDNFLWTAHIDDTLDRYRGHYQPISDVQEVILRLHTFCAGLGGQLLVKPHPSCREAENFRYPQGVHFYKGALDPVLRAADVIVGWNSKVLFNAVALQKPVLCLSRNPLLATGGCYEVSSIDMLEETIVQALHQLDLGRKFEMFSRLLPSLAERQYFSIERGPCYNLGAKFSSMCDELIQIATTRDTNQRPSVQAWYALCTGRTYNAGDLVRDKRTKVLIEVTRLNNEGLYYSGISRYIRELVKRLAEQSDIYFTAASWKENRWEYKGGAPLLDESQYDLFHSPHEPLREVATDRRVITIHDTVHLKLKPYYPARDVPYQEFHIYRVLKSIRPRDFVICDSEATKRDFLCYALVDPSNVYVAHLGADLPENVAKERGRNIFLLYQQDPRKNCEVYFRLAEHLKREAWNWKLLMIIPKYAQEELERKLSELDLDNVELFSDPSDREKVQLMNRCAFGVFVPFYEGFGLPVVEAVNTGLPMIVSNTSSLMELDVTGVSYVSPFRWEDIWSSVREWVNAPDRIPDLEGHQTRFSWDQSVVRTIGVYASIVARIWPKPETTETAQAMKRNNARSRLDIQCNAKVRPGKYFLFKAGEAIGDFVAHGLGVRPVLISLALSAVVGIGAGMLVGTGAGGGVYIVSFIGCLLGAYAKENRLISRLGEYMDHVRR